MKCPRCGKHNVRACGFHKNNQTHSYEHCPDCGYVSPSIIAIHFERGLTGLAEGAGPQ
jgi:uncharacterized Zn finger protein